MLWRFVMSVIVAAAAGGSFYRYHCQGKRTGFGHDRRQTDALVEPLLLPVVLLAATVTVLVLGESAVAERMAYRCVGVFLQISLYFAALLCLLPLLRERIDARACAALWILPNLLYITTYTTWGRPEPLLLIPIPGKTVQRVFVVVWLVGVVAVLLWQVVSHLHFRRQLLKGAKAVENWEILKLWARESGGVKGRHQIPLYYSDRVKTPLTIGCFRFTALLILPRREYSREELELIFRHELHHIRRLDMRTKVFLGFCAALCWFNPLMWLARRRASEDLELSCDEEILKEADEATRRRYAELLLRTAGDSRGFSTCLSAGASSLRCRLKNAVEPRAKTSGTLCVAVAVLLLFLSSSAIAFAEPAGTVEELIFSRYPEHTRIEQVVVKNWEEPWDYRRLYGWQEETLAEYIGSLRVRQVHSEGYDQAVEGRQMVIRLVPPDESEASGELCLSLGEELLWVDIVGDGRVARVPYLLEDEVNWDYVESLLDFNAKAPDPLLEWPRWMQVELTGEQMEEPICLDLAGTILNGSWKGVTLTTLEEVVPEDAGGIFGFPAEEARLIFPYSPVDYEVLVQNWDRTQEYTLTDSQMEEDRFALASYDAHYVVYARFSPEEDAVYEVAFPFDVTLPEE